MVQIVRSIPGYMGSDKKTFIAAATKPSVGVTASGLYLSIPSANVDPGGVAIPAGATRVVVFFETSSGDATLTRGRVGFNASATAIGSLTGTDALLAYQPPVPVEYQIPSAATHLHLASLAAGVIARGSWLFGE